MDLSLAPTLASLKPALKNVFQLAEKKIAALDKSWNPARGTPVFTAAGKYTSRGWTEWTQGFQFGMPILAFDATGNKKMLELGRTRTTDRMAPHVSHIGVHDHGFNNISTYGNLRRLMREGKIKHNQDELNFYEMALKTSGAVQAARWTSIFSDPSQPQLRDTGYIHSFNGPHSLFSDTIRSVRSLMLAHQLGHTLMGENDKSINLLHRGIHHALTTAKYNVYYGLGRDAYDTPVETGRVVHESIFNTTDGRYRCPSTQQGYSPFTTWTRGLAWILCGFAEELEFLAACPKSAFDNFPLGTKPALLAAFQDAAVATAEWYLCHSFVDGMVYWDAGAPNIPGGSSCCGDDCDGDNSSCCGKGEDCCHGQSSCSGEGGCCCDGSLYDNLSDPYNDHEPIDSSAAAIAGQGFYRLAKYLAKSDKERSNAYRNAALRIAGTLFEEPYLSTSLKHEGLILHSVYHRPNHWDYIPPGQSIPCGESSLWGDYHAVELALLLWRELNHEPHITFFDR